VEEQDLEIRDYCEEAGELLYDGPTIADRDRGAAYDAEERPGWRLLMSKLETLQYGGVAVRDADRAARDNWLGEGLIRLVRQNNLVGFRVVSPIVTYDLSTQKGASDFRRALDEAEKEVELIRRRTRVVLKRKAISGEPTNGHKRAFGWIDKPNGVKEPTEAKHIREASIEVVEAPDFQMCDLVNDWRERGILTIKGAPFIHTTLKAMLLRPSNAGLITASGSVRGRLPGDPIVEESLFEQVVARFAAMNRGRPPMNTYLMSSLGILRCSRCRSRMSGSKMPRQQPPVYNCGYDKSSRDLIGCRRSISMAGVDAFVREKTIAWWCDPVRAAQDHLYVLPTAHRDQQLMQQIDTIEERIVSLATKIELPPDRFESAITALNERKALLTARLAASQAPPVLESVTAEHVSAMWDESLKSRRTMIKAAIKTIWVERHIPAKGSVRSFQPQRLTVEYW
jgi:DNA invertase Pin-like site-specific DNA recombinase